MKLEISFVLNQNGELTKWNFALTLPMKSLVIIFRYFMIRNLDYINAIFGEN